MMQWELEALKMLARNPTVPGVALKDACQEIERLRRQTEKDGALLASQAEQISAAVSQISTLANKLEEKEGQLQRVWMAFEVARNLYPDIEKLMDDKFWVE